MLKCKCIEKFRNSANKIIGYRLRDKQGNIKDFKADEVKNGIKNNALQVENLKLTSDGRLVDDKYKDSGSDIRDMFKNCTGEVSMGQVDTDNAVDMRNMFKGCK